MDNSLPTCVARAEILCPLPQLHFRALTERALAARADLHSAEHYRLHSSATASQPVQSARGVPGIRRLHRLVRGAGASVARPAASAPLQTASASATVSHRQPPAGSNHACFCAAWRPHASQLMPCSMRNGSPPQSACSSQLARASAAPLRARGRLPASHGARTVGCFAVSRLIAFRLSRPRRNRGTA